MGAGGSVTVMSKHRSYPLVPSKGMSMSAGHVENKMVILFKASLTVVL